MIKRVTRLASAVGIFLWSSFTVAAPAAYLPVGVDTYFEAQIETLFSLARHAPMSKPYRIADIEQALGDIKMSHPELYHRISGKLQPYQGTAQVSRAGAVLRYQHGADMPIANQRGLTTQDWAQGIVEGLWRPNNHTLVQAGFDYRPSSGELVPYNTFVAVAGAGLQLNLGYKEHWFSPFHFSGQLFSTNAKASPSVSLTLVSPANNWWNADFELFYTQLDKVEDGIRFDGETFDGKPHVAGMHISIEPVSGWKIAVNRIMQFGGGPRNTGISDIFQAFLDPAGNDNSNTDAQRNNETGDQIASVTSNVHFDVGMPVSLYFEYAGEDTQGDSNFSLGNQAMNVGVYLPALGQDVSARYEYNRWKTAWYTNGLYPAGNTNKGRIFGHWAADRRIFGDAVPAQVHTLALDFHQNSDTFWQLKYSLQYNESQAYERAHELQLLNSQIAAGHRIESVINYGRDVFGNTYGHASVAWFWK